MKLVGEPQGVMTALGIVNRYVQDQFGTAAYSDWSTVKSFDRTGNPVYCNTGLAAYLGSRKMRK